MRLQLIFVSSPPLCFHPFVLDWFRPGSFLCWVSACLTPPVATSLHPHLSLLLHPSVFSHFILPCVHFSDLSRHRAPSVHTPRVYIKRPKSSSFHKIKELKTQHLPHYLSHSFSLFFSSVFQPCLCCGRSISLFTGLDIVCYHSTLFTVHVPWQQHRSVVGRLLVCV